MKKIFGVGLIPAMTVLMSYGAYAQTDNGVGRGVLMSRNVLKISDMYNLSSYNQGFGTSRSAAMGGAFTSLGGDLASISINPAGLGMYQSSEVGFTAGVLRSETSSSLSSATYIKTRPVLNNLSTALNIYQGTGGLTSFTLGFGYNQLADFNYKTTVSGGPGNTSIVDAFMFQMKGIRPSDFTREPYELDRDKWGALMAREAGLIQPYQDLDGNYFYDTYAIAADADISHKYNLFSEGYIGEYSIAGGMNFKNMIYFGFAIGLQDIYLKQTHLYRESYDNNSGAADPADRMEFSQIEKISGTGVNFKAGIIIRPVECLRLGVAVHTPTLINYKKRYSGDIRTDYRDGSWENAYMDVTFLNDKFVTPTRLMAGASLSLGNFAVFSADYERTWYNGIRLVTSDVPEDTKDWYTDEIKEHFRVSNTLRLGVEVKPLPSVALRAGFAEYGSALRNSSQIYDDPIGYRTRNLSAGIGLRPSKNFSIDFAYILMKTTYTQYVLFSYDGHDNSGNPVDIYSGNIDRKLTRHNAIVSLSLRF